MKPPQDFDAHGSAILGLCPRLQPQLTARQTPSLDLAEERRGGGPAQRLQSGCDQIPSCRNQDRSERRRIIQRAAQKKRPLKPRDGVLRGFARSER